MPTIIDSLIVKLGLDTTDYDKGRKKVGGSLKDTGKEAKEMGKKVKESAREGSSGFNDMAKEATKFLAIIGGTAAVTNFAKNVIESSAAMYRFSQNIKESFTQISILGGAAEVAGGSVEGLQGTLDMLSKAQTELKLTGQSSLLGFFSALKISHAEAAGSVTDLLNVIHNKMMGKDRKDMFNLGQMFGVDAGTMNLLLSSDEEFKALLEWQAKLNKLTEKQAKQYKDMSQSLTKLRQEMEAYGISLLSDAAPAIMRIIDLFEGFGTWIKQHGGFVLGFLGTMGTYLAIMGAKALPISLLAAELLLLAVAIGLVADDFRTFKEGGDSLIPWQNAIDGVSKLIEWLDKLLDKMQEVAYNPVTKLLGAGNALIAAIKGDRKGMQIAYGAGSGAYSPSSGAGSLEQKLANAEKENGLPAGTLSAIIKQETGGNRAYIDDPSKYHYGLNAQGKRIAPHTGKVSTAFGPFGLLESTARDPGWGIEPLKNKGIDEQIRLISQYVARRSKSAGSLQAGLAGYGEGAGYANSVLSGIPGASQAAMAGGAIASNAPSRSVTNSIGEMKIYTQATDAEGIMRDAGQAIDYLSISQANTGQM